MTAPIRVGILFGGSSVEHEVSVVSARGVASALDASRFTAVPLGITGDGRWLPPEVSAGVLSNGAKRVEGTGTKRLVLDPGNGGLVALEVGKPAQPLPVDVIFSVVHGWGGEDGRIQGALDLIGIPCVGPGVLGSAVGMDKQVSKSLFQERGLPVAPWMSVLREEWESDPDGTRRRASALGWPVFTKPANGGSSVGISKVRGAADLDGALAAAFDHDRKVVIEKGLDVREIECAVLGNEAPEVSVCGEIVPSGEFYDYAAKYEDGTSQLFIPAKLDAAVSERIRGLAIEAFKALELSGMARVDFFLERTTGEVFLNEVNTLPGFTPISMYPKLWEASGVSYGELLARLIELARRRAADDGRRRTRRDG